MTSFTGGMGMLPRRLAAGFAEKGEVVYGTSAHSVIREKEGWRVRSEQDERLCRHLILALPVNRCLELLANALPTLPPPLSAIPEARILSVLLGFDSRARIPFGFGYLAPEREQRFALGALFSSHMFPGRAPADHQLLEALVGGRRHPERLELSDAQLIDSVYTDLSQLMELPPPSFSAVLRPRCGIPQLEEGYTNLLAWRKAIHTTYPTLHLCGFGWKGIGLNDMIKEARHIAGTICTQSAAQEGPEVKGVYF